ncbi:Ubiquitin-conjugating enzyme E2 D4 [Tyrophagus putrescentiae]|nr:Ubiquitin-conjugating enzyme E2 D4 [Tyrophagus putrescentiae]
MSRESVTVNPAAKRIEKDLAKFKADQAAQAMYHIEPENEDDIFQLKGYVFGPPDTPYQGGVFHLKMTVPNDYPFRPPVCKMTTKVWHPNIGEAGSICLDTLSGKWTAAMSIRTAMMSIQALLSTPNSDSGLNGTVTYLMNKDREAYQKTATFWTYHYAVVNKTEQMMADNAPMEL